MPQTLPLGQTSAQATVHNHNVGLHAGSSGATVQDEDDDSLSLFDLLGDDPFVLREFLPNLGIAGLGRGTSAGNSDGRSNNSKAPMGSHQGEDAVADEATLAAEVTKCLQLTRVSDLGDLYFSAATGRSCNNSSATTRGEPLLLQRVEGWEHRGTRLYAFNLPVASCAPSELRRHGLTPSSGPQGELRALPSLATRAAAFADIVLLPLARVFQIPASSLAAAVGPRLGRGCNVQGLICLGLSRFQTADGRDERCRWFAEVCRLMATSGSAGFTSEALTVALVARHLPKLIELETSGGDSSSEEDAARALCGA